MTTSINFKRIGNEEYKKLKRFDIVYGIQDTKFGKCLIGLNKNDICYVYLFDEGGENTAVDNLQKDWPNAVLKQDDASTLEVGKDIFERPSGKKLNVVVKGTELQTKVWKELTNVKAGATASYQNIAQAVGHPKAIRAVAQAIAKNKIAYLVPCHRVIRKTGAPNKYRWGPQRKLDMLKYEEHES